MRKAKWLARRKIVTPCMSHTQSLRTIIKVPLIQLLMIARIL